MKAIVKTKRSVGAELKSIKEPQIGPTDVLLEMKAAAICGADIYIYFWTKQALGFNIPIPLVFGHEMSGEVVDVGKDVDTLRKGDRVAVETHIPCKKCRLCHEGNMHICRNLKIFGIHVDGAFSEFNSVPEICAYKIPDNVSFEEAALFEPLGVGIHAVTVSGLKIGDTVAVLGCGPIGLSIIAAARESGATKIIASAVHGFRRELAKKMGATSVLDGRNIDNIDDITNGEGVNIVFETSGSMSALHQAFEMIKIHGKIVVVGVQPEPVAVDYYKNVIGKEAIVIGSYGRLMWDTWTRVSNIVSEARIDVKSFITHRIYLKDMKKAFDIAKQKECGKILLLP